MTYRIATVQNITDRRQTDGQMDDRVQQ